MHLQGGPQALKALALPHSVDLSLELVPAENVMLIKSNLDRNNYIIAKPVNNDDSFYYVGKCLKSNSIAPKNISH